VKSQGTGKLLRVFVGESNRWHGQPLYTAIVEELRRAGLAGATVFRGIEGYGAHQVVHAARVFDLAADLPILIEVIDDEARIRAALPILGSMIQEGRVTLESVEVIRYGPKAAPGTGEPS
jgi:PII-like signaling protein